MSGHTGIILAPLGTLYGAVTRARLALYRAGALTVQRVSSPVISVGNITTGGAGKTPLVEWIARALAQRGERVCILTRGYGREKPGSRVLVSDGMRILADARTGGDEPLLLAETLGGVAVVSDADRVAAARWAAQSLQSSVFVLDDGFQYLRLARELNLVAIDATNPWGGSRLLPRGRLREPLKELKRADCLVITRAEQVQDTESLRKQVERLSGGRPVLVSRTRIKGAQLLAETPNASAPVEMPQALAAFCAVGNPPAFFAQARLAGYTLNLTRAFRDHHFYAQSEMDALVAEAGRLGARALLTTAKDAVKLRSLRLDLPCYVLRTEVEFEDEAKMLGMIDEALQARTRLA
ncbi:MAG TPA: tetraacyldisaccharide 4'-kinase [Pyrinomonadaceae bacterium]|jgi:tetraacyldisaccharide 4'-kinase